MLLTFPFRIRIAESQLFQVLPLCLIIRNRARKDGLAIAALQLGAAPFQQPVPIWWCGKALQYPHYPCKGSFFSSPPLCSLLQPASWGSCVWPPTPGPWLAHQLFSNNHRCQPNKHWTSNFRAEMIPDAFLTCTVVHFS